MIRIIGLGSPYGDDRAGWDVVARLRGTLPTDIDLQALDRPGAGLINWLDGVDHLVLIDAVAAGRPGRVLRIDPGAVARTPSGFSAHALRLDETLRLAQTLDCLPRRMELYGITLATLDGAGPTAEVGAAVDELADWLQHDLTGSGGTSFGHA